MREENKVLEKICFKCNIKKLNTDFYLLESICKECRCERQKNLYMEKKDEINEKRKQALRDKIKKIEEEDFLLCRICLQKVTPEEYNVEYKKCNNCKRKKHNDYMSKRKQNEPIFKIISYTRTRLYQILRVKRQTTKDYLGDNLELVKNWLEFCFVEKINWNNHGLEWHIDHVIPVSRFNLHTEDDVIKCFNWKNLSPLSKKENLKKSNNIVLSQIYQHIQKLRLFTSKYYNDKYKEVEEYISTTFYPYFNYNQTNTNLQNTLMLETPKDLTTTL